MEVVEKIKTHFTLHEFFRKIVTFKR